MELPAQRREQVHSRVRFPLQQNGDIVPRYFQTFGSLERDGGGLVRGLLQHGSEPKELALRRFIQDHLLMVLVHSRDPDFTGDHHVRLPARVSLFVNALARSECFELNLCRQHRGFIVVEQGK